MPTSIYVKRNGETLTPIREKDRLELVKLPEGKPLRATVTKPRNSKVHRLYFAAIKAAAKHWPESHHYQPQGDESALRAFLQCEAGWCKKIPFALSSKDSVIELIQSTADKDRWAFVNPGMVKIPPMQVPEMGLIVSTPFSVDYEAADDDEFSVVKTKVLDMIEDVIGVPIMQLIEENENEA